MRKPVLRSAVHHSDSHVLWYLAIVMVCCVGWLLHTVFGTLL
jgi:hypothetical protein